MAAVAPTVLSLFKAYESSIPLGDCLDSIQVFDSLFMSRIDEG